jgi:zinc protease
MKKIIHFNLFIALLFLSTFTSAQEINLNDPLPVDNTFKKGVLPNGMTYYIKNTDVTKNVASYYIIQNVGSILENDDQQGLAHFLEHMAFNGSQNFAGKGILNTMEKHGLIFGRDINAYTSFDETVYNVDNIPTKPELIDTGLQILSDWSNFLLLTDTEIDAERGVIKEEWRTRQSGGMRILQQNLGTMFNNTIYAKRLPIGSMDVVEKFKYKALRDFYHDWYRTDLQAIAVVGDINVDEIEKKIIALFSKIPAVKNPKRRFAVEIPENKELIYSMAKDKEVTTSQISFSIRHARSTKDETVSDLKTSLLNSMVTSMLSSRLREISQNPDAPFLGAGIGYSSLTRNTNSFSASISPKPNQQQIAFATVFDEIIRAVKFGFTQEEINRTVTQFSTFYENQISKKDDISHGRLIQSIKQNYLENITIADMEKEYELIKAIFKNLTTPEIHETIKNLYSKENRSMTVTGVEGNDNLTKEVALSIITAAENNATLVAYSDGFSGKTLISGLKIEKGSIVKEETNSTIGSTTFTLSNGAKVHYKFVNKNKNDVQLNAVSYGGMSLINDENLPSATLLGSVIQFSGLGDYSPTDLPKVLAGKTAATTIFISDLTESVSGSSTTKDIETLMQMVHLRFVKPRFDQNGYKVLMNNLDNYIIRRSKTIGEQISDSITVTLYGHNNPKARLFNNDLVKDVSFEKIKSIYLERFNNAADFEFFIIGDIDANTLKPLLEKYIASIPASTNKEEWKDNSISWVQNKIDKDVFLKMEDPKSSVSISYKNDYPYTLKNSLVARALGDILQLRYTETLREQEGGTYGASARASVSKKPTQEASITIRFDCNPDKVEELVAIVHKEVEKMAQGTIEQSDLSKSLTNYLKDRKEQQDYNRYEMSLLTNYFREGYNMNDPKNFEDIVNSITVKDIQEFTKNLLKNAKQYEIVIKPIK